MYRIDDTKRDPRRRNKGREHECAWWGPEDVRPTVSSSYKVGYPMHFQSRTPRNSQLSTDSIPGTSKVSFGERNSSHLCIDAAICQGVLHMVLLFVLILEFLHEISSGVDDALGKNSKHCTSLIGAKSQLSMRQKSTLWPFTYQQAAKCLHNQISQNTNRDTAGWVVSPCGSKKIYDFHHWFPQERRNRLRDQPEETEARSSERLLAAKQEAAPELKSRSRLPV